jgi:plasmid maintenance system antidote protein VapI/archaellum component FlaF (FlaF/FlaG flagellin family)
MASNIDFYLTALDSSLNVTKANITVVSDNTDTNNNPKAVAELFVDASAVRQIFQFATNSSDLNDVSDNDIYYFTNALDFATIPSTTVPITVGGTPGTKSGELAEMIGDAYISQVKNSAVNHALDPLGVAYPVDNKGLIKDLFRDLAHQLFKTQYGVDIFNNEADLSNSTATSLAALFDEGGSIYLSLNGANELTNTNTTSANICKILLDKIIATNPGRLADLSTNIYTVNTGTYTPAAPNNSPVKKYCIPLLKDDSIRFHIECKFDSTQNTIVNDPTLVINSRWYEVVLKLR